VYTLTCWVKFSSIFVIGFVTSHSMMTGPTWAKVTVRTDEWKLYSYPHWEKLGQFDLLYECSSCLLGSNCLIFFSQWQVNSNHSIGNKIPPFSLRFSWNKSWILYYETKVIKLNSLPLLCQNRNGLIFLCVRRSVWHKFYPTSNYPSDCKTSNYLSITLYRFSGGRGINAFEYYFEQIFDRFNGSNI